MLEQLSDQTRECYEGAAEARRGTNDLALNAELLNTEGEGGFIERLEDFTAVNWE
jgi:hypothetical protein